MYKRRIPCLSRAHSTTALTAWVMTPLPRAARVSQKPSEPPSRSRIVTTPRKRSLWYSTIANVGSSELLHFRSTAARGDDRRQEDGRIWLAERISTHTNPLADSTARRRDPRADLRRGHSRRRIARPSCAPVARRPVIDRPLPGTRGSFERCDHCEPGSPRHFGPLPQHPARAGPHPRLRAPPGSRRFRGIG